MPLPLDLFINDMHHFFYVFARVLGLIIGMPFLSQTEIPTRFKAVTCFCLTFAFAPMVKSNYFPIDLNLLDSFVRFFIEFLLGLFLGLIARFALAAIEFAGGLISVATGLSMSTMYNPSQANQGTVISTFLSVAAVTIFLCADGHHFIIKNFLHTYSIFSKEWFTLESKTLSDLTKAIIELSDEFFKAGLSMSIPFLVINSILQIALGLIGKLVPQIQVFFLNMSLQVLIGFFVLLMCIGSILLCYEKLTVSMYEMIGLTNG